MRKRGGGETGRNGERHLIRMYYIVEESIQLKIVKN